MPCLRDLDDRHVGVPGECFPLVVGEPDVVAFAEDDPRRNAGIAQARRERSVAVEIGEIRACLPAEEARVVSPKFGYERIAPGRRKAALHRGTDHLEHQRVGQVSEDAAEDVERARKLGLVLARGLGERRTTGPLNAPVATISIATFAPRL